MTTTKIVLVLGAGGNIGASVASTFAQHGYKIALAARSLQDSVKEDGHLHIRADFAEAQSVESAFDRVSAEFGGPPNVVVYNAASVQPVPSESPVDLSLASFNHDIAVNTGGVLVAVRRAVLGFEQLPSSTPKTFIYTGNFLNKHIMPPLVSLGMGKSATAHLLAVTSKVYAGRGYRFYFADERKADGGAAFRELNGANHAEHYLALAETTEGRPWLQTFVGGQGYKNFTTKDIEI